MKEKTFNLLFDMGEELGPMTAYVCGLAVGCLSVGYGGGDFAVGVLIGGAVGYGIFVCAKVGWALWRRRS